LGTSGGRRSPQVTCRQRQKKFINNLGNVPVRDRCGAKAKLAVKNVDRQAGDLGTQACGGGLAALVCPVQDEVHLLETFGGGLAPQVCGEFAAGVRDGLRGAAATVHCPQDGDRVTASRMGCRG
jgi:hypothetical protein